MEPESESITDEEMEQLEDECEEVPAPGDPGDIANAWRYEDF